jgi:RNA polymerase sigma factor (TIGR02999 family)
MLDFLGVDRSATTLRVAHLLVCFRKGDKTATKELVSLFYPELRRLAAVKMRGERSDHSWQPTVLVNEFYLELMKIRKFQTGVEQEVDKSAFFGLAAHLMKRLLIHHARPLYRRARRVEMPEMDADPARCSAEDLAEVDQLLDKLAKVNARLRLITEMKVFEGMTNEEIAACIGCGVSTIVRDWSFARQWLEEKLSTAD